MERNRGEDIRSFISIRLHMQLKSWYISENRIGKKERLLPIWHLQWCPLGILIVARTAFLISPLPATYFSNTPKAKNHSSFLYFSGSRNCNLSTSFVALLQIYIVNLSILSTSIAFCYSSPSPSLIWTMVIVSIFYYRPSPNSLTTQQLEWLF